MLWSDMQSNTFCCITKYLFVYGGKKKRFQRSWSAVVRIVVSNFHGVFLEFSFRYTVDKYIKHLVVHRMSHGHFGTRLSSSSERSVHASVQGQC